MAVPVVMVVGTGQDEVAQVGGTAIDPMMHMMGVTAVRGSVAARADAALVANVQGPPNMRRH